ncbi:MAG: type II toxin-antitoxin system VapC family toxin [Lentisphaeria bacterium]|jgi:predicted nucleic-acid-binding protein|nr:type II toxin-antitoxin system VapC family toxin [Lentisphaeria bacterium]
MVGIDTNVLVRQILQDDEEQAALARALFEGQLDASHPGHLPLVVLCELVWVLGTAYGYSRQQVVPVLRQVLVTDCLVVERHALAWAALNDYAAGNADYADCLIARINREEGAEFTFTFDRKAAKGEGFRLLTAENLG